MRSSIGRYAIELRTSARLAIALVLASSIGSSLARAEGMHAELGLGLSGLLSVGDLAKVSSYGVGGDGALHLVQIYRGFGVRGALGYQRLKGYEIPTGESTIPPLGGPPEEGTFTATQHFYWNAIGPEWRASAGSSDVDLYLLFGRANVTAHYSGEWLNTQGARLGDSRVSLIVVGGTWIPAGAPMELGIEAFAGGSAVLWADPPAVVDSAGNHVLQYTSASITGIALRAGYRFGHPRRDSRTPSAE